MTDLLESAARVTKILQRAQSDADALQELEQFRRTLAVMFSDIQGSTAYYEKHGDAAGLFMVRRCNDMIRRVVEKWGGAVIKTIGDGSMATFADGKAAVQAAIETQNALTHPSDSTANFDKIALRLGIHYGMGIVSTNDVFGDVVNVASRVESVAKAGQIVLSEETFHQVREYGFPIYKLGRFTLKGKTEERTLFHVRWDQGRSTEAGVQLVPTETHVFKLQTLNKDGDITTEHPIQPELRLGISSDGALTLSPEANSCPTSARVFVEGDQLFIEEVKGARGGIFIRLSGAYVLEDRDIFLAGQQIFRYEEKREITSSATKTATGPLADLLSTANAATLTRTDASGKPLARYALDKLQIQFGRTRGEHVFPSDTLMSSLHIKISRRGEDFVLEDLGSRNGTFVKVIGKKPLASGAAIVIGGQLIGVIR